MLVLRNNNYSHVFEQHFSFLKNFIANHSCYRMLRLHKIWPDQLADLLTCQAVIRFAAKYNMETLSLFSNFS